MHYLECFTTGNMIVVHVKGGSRHFGLGGVAQVADPERYQNPNTSRGMPPQKIFDIFML